MISVGTILGAALAGFICVLGAYCGLLAGLPEQQGRTLWPWLAWLICPLLAFAAVFFWALLWP